MEKLIFIAFYSICGAAFLLGIPFMLMNRDRLISSFFIALAWGDLWFVIIYSSLKYMSGDVVGLRLMVRLMIGLSPGVAFIYWLGFMLAVGVQWMQRQGKMGYIFDEIDRDYAGLLWFLRRDSWKGRSERT